MVPTNNNYDIKIPLTPEVVVGPRLKDVYTIPNELKFKSPLLNKGTYEGVELPKTDFTDSYYMWAIKYYNIKYINNKRCLH